jgi:hypothetical protein
MTSIGKMLLELSESWHVSLETSANADGCWFLTLTPHYSPKTGWARTPNDTRCHSYYGGNLIRVVSAAWAGEPDGEIK